MADERTEQFKKSRAQRKALASIYGQGGVDAGNALADLYAKPGFLGRLDTDLNQFKAGLQGYTAPEYQAQREQMQQGINSQFATAQNQLNKSQARGKVYGAAASAQQANLIQGAENSKNNLEQQLMVQNIDERQKRLSDFYNKQTEAQKYNAGNEAAEVSTRINAFTGAAGQSILNANNRASQDLYQKALQSLYGQPMGINAPPVSVKPAVKPKPKVKGIMAA